jgi:hypothetical protein
MESFSTPQHAALPWIANLATVAVVMATIGWSNGQRPAASPSEAALTTPAHQMAVPAGMPAAAQTPASPQATQATQAHWPAQTTAVAVDGLQAVGFNANNRR